MRKVFGHRCTNLGNSAGGVGSCIPTNSQKQEQITNNYTNMHIKKTDSNILCGLDGCVFGDLTDTELSLSTGELLEYEIQHSCRAVGM